MNQHPFTHEHFNQVIYVGGGKGDTFLRHYNSIKAMQWLLLEGDEYNYNQLQDVIKGAELNNVEVKHCVVSATGQPATWFKFNATEFNGLAKPTGLKELFPGLKATAQEQVPTQSLSSLIDSLQLSSDNNLIIIDTPGYASQLLTSLQKSKQFDTIDHVLLTDAGRGLFAEDKEQHVNQWLTQHHFDVLAKDDTDPDFIVTAAHVSATSRQVKSLTKERDELRDALNNLTKAFTKSQEQLLARIDELTASQEEHTRRITDTVIRKTANSTKQLEAFLGVQQFFRDGEAGLSFHGWPISSDIAFYLLNKIKHENFDLIIEFGSGTSTILFAKAVAMITAKGEPGHAHKHIGEIRQQEGTRELQIHDIEDAGEVPSRIVSFEHNKTFYEKTLMGLREASVESWVSLVHAPLIEWRNNNESYLHYDCDKVLTRIAEHFEGRTAKILVFIDGPPASTGEQARYPAVPKILQHLSRHELHIIMDDYVREDEKKSAGRWSKMIEERGIPCDKELIRLEKDGFSWLLNRKNKA